MRLIEQLRASCHYSPDQESTVDQLIDYKDALEDLVGRVDELALANNGEPAAERYRAERCERTISAADVMGGLFSMGFGELPDA